MEKKVTVLTPNGRRQTVKVTPNTTLLQILEEACRKHDFDSDSFVLRHHNKEVGLTQIFRFSGLPNNCVLEMAPTNRKRVTANVSICIQLEDGTREQGEFSPTDNLWAVVLQLRPEAAASYDSPVAIYMRQDIVGQEQMSQTSLKSLGITEGRAMVRLINKDPQELKKQANVYIPPTAKAPKEANEEAKTPRSSAPTGGGGGGGFALTAQLVQSLKPQVAATDVTAKGTAKTAEEPMETAEVEAQAVKAEYDWGTAPGHSIRGPQTDSDAEVAQAEVPETVEPEVHIIGPNNAIVYSLEDIPRPGQEEDLPDSFFELTVHDLKLVLRDLQKISTGNEDAPLLTEKLRELQENKTMLNKISQYKNCVIRIKFPSRFVLQGMFKPINKISDVTEFVRHFLRDPTAPFHLFTIPPKTVLPLDKTLLELDCVPTALLHFGYDGAEETSPPERFLKEEHLAQLTSAEGAIFAANKFRVAAHRRRSSARSEDGEGAASSPRTEGASGLATSGPGPATGAIPKRF